MPETPIHRLLRLLRSARAASVALGLLAVLPWTATARADHLLTLSKTSDGPQMTGARRGPANREVRVWLGRDRVRRDDGQTTTILRLDRSTLYIVDHHREVFHALELPIRVADFLPTGMEGVYDALHFDGTATATDQRATVGGSWQARRYDLRLESEMGLVMDVELWLSPDPPVDAALYRRLASVLASVQPGGDWTVHLKDTPGFPVRQAAVIEALGGTTHITEELRSVAEAKPPAGTYEPPTGYAEERFDPLDELGAKKRGKKTAAKPSKPAQKRADESETVVEDIEVLIEKKGAEPDPEASEPPVPFTEERGRRSS